MFENRIVALRQHLLRNHDRNTIMTYITKTEEDNIIRVGYELLKKIRNTR